MALFTKKKPKPSTEKKSDTKELPTFMSIRDAMKNSDDVHGMIDIGKREAEGTIVDIYIYASGCTI
jgi:hypothetical protein